VASHGYGHELCGECTIKDLRKDLTDSKKLLEDIIGDQVFGYRAPSFSVDGDILKIIEECGYLYDSSYNSFHMHGRYGKISLNGGGRRGIAYKISDSFYEVPISNLPLLSFPNLGNLGTLAQSRHFSLPWGGGGYFRLIPYTIFQLGIRSILKRQNAYLFYMHPWEIDPEQPKVNGGSFFCKFRHYLNLEKSESRLTKLLKSFNHSRFLTCHSYMAETMD
jgi:polysaccharide deacetylase family protein (PEP-CTERM system associated)